jgi:predicted Zn finger-like uncharacterized protein
MSFTTRCPACATMFRVVPDQLKISDGWVRCGHCSDVFDATLYLEPWTPPEAQAEEEEAQEPATPLPAETAAVEPEYQSPVQVGVTPGAAPSWGHPQGGDDPTSEGSAQLAGASVAPVAEFPSPSLAEPVASFSMVDRADTLVEEPADDWNSLVSVDAGEPPPGSLSQDGPPPFDSNRAEPGDFHAELKRFAAGTRGEPIQEAGIEDAEPEQRLVEALPESEVEAVESEPLHQAEPAETSAPAPADEPDERVAEPAVEASSEPEFVRQARRRAFWQSPVMRGVLSLLALVLLAVLAGQWALHERDRLAARFPESMPLLTQACELLGCEVGAVHNIDAILIDSSTLARKLGNFYSFDLVLKNNAPLALAVPALELSLTDTRDTVISRRVFLPEELPGVPPLLPAHGSVSVSLRLSLNVGEDQPMAGYRALVFYP